jgi:hypothetical protein
MDEGTTGYSINQTIDGGFIVAGDHSMGDVYFIKTDGSGIITDVNELKDSMNSTCLIYPNPFISRTTIEFSVINNGHIDLSVFDVSGKLIQTILEGPLPDGIYSINWRATNIGSGIYFLRICTKDTCELKKMILNE